MFLRILGVCLVAVLAGCISSTQEVVIPLPKSDSSFYDAADGRRWVLDLETHSGNGIDFLGFSPEHAKPGPWKETLSFSLTTEDLSQAGLRKSLGGVRDDLDPNATFSFTGSEDAFIVTYHFPHWNHRGVQKVVRSGKRFSSFAYEERLGSEADQRLQFWTEYLEGIPDQTLREMRLD
jgi:hypothetical protein